MHPDDRVLFLCLWNAAVVFVTMFYFTGAIVKSAVLTVVILISSLLGYGQRWLLRAGFAAMALTIAVSLGAVPPPDQWIDFLKNVQDHLMVACAGIFGRSISPLPLS
jgi:uncharacterized membrane protein